MSAVRDQIVYRTPGGVIFTGKTEEEIAWKLAQRKKGSFWNHMTPRARRFQMVAHLHEMRHPTPS